MKFCKNILSAGCLLLVASGVVRAQSYTFTTLAGLAGTTGSADGTNSSAKFKGPQNVAVDSAGNVYVADTLNSTIRKATPSISGQQTNWVVTTLAGSAGNPGSADGTNSSAMFFLPWGVAVDSAGNLYVAEYGNDTIRKVSPSISGQQTNWVVTTLAGGTSGSANGTDSSAQFDFPTGVAVDSAGNLYVADTGNETIRKVTLSISGLLTNWVVTTLAGSAGSPGFADGTGSSARFYFPNGVAVDSAGNLYVADSSNEAIRKITPNISGLLTNWVVTTLAGGGFGSANGTNSSAQFDFPTGVAVDSAGNLYVGDQNNNTIRKITPSISGLLTNWVVTTLAGVGNPGSADGTGSNARFNSPAAVAVDSLGNLYVADAGNNTIRKGTTPQPPPPTGSPVSVLVYYPFNTNGIPGSGTAAFTNNYLETATIGSNLSAFSNYNAGTNVTFVAGTANSAVSNAPAGNAVSDSYWVGNTNYFQFTFNATGYQPLTVNYDVLQAHNGPQTNQFQYSADGGATFTVFTNFFHNSPLFLPSVIDLSGIDSLINNSNVVFRIVGAGGTGNGAMSVDNFTVSGITAGPSYNFTTLAGSAGSQGTNDGTGSGARFNNPVGVAVDSAGNVYVADQGNRTIRKVTSAGVVTTLAGMAGSFGSVDGTNSSARFEDGSGVAVDSAGNLYVGDFGSDTIRKVTPSITGQQTNWVVTTLAGLADNPGNVDGTNSSARFNGIEGVAVDSAGNLYVADSSNNTIRKVTPSIAGQQTNWVVTTLAGLAGNPGSIDGTGSVARLSGLEGMTVDNAGNLYVGDTGNNTIREVTPSIAGQQTNWVVTTLAGLAGSQGTNDGTSSSARFGTPRFVVVDNTGNIYVGDLGNSTIRKVTPSIAGQQTNWVVTTLAGLAGSQGTNDGIGSIARFHQPNGVAVDSAGNVYVTDSASNTIRKGSPFSGINPGIDIGLRAYDGHGIVKIGAQSGAPTSPLRINKNGTNYGVILVPTNSASASRVRIQTSEGIQSLEKLP